MEFKNRNSRVDSLSRIKKSKSLVIGIDSI